MHPHPLVKPRFRGRLHQIAFFVSVPAGVVLITLARTPQARMGALVFAVTLIGLYGVSAAYHRGRWSDRANALMRRLDHSMIYVFIAGTYTPIALLALRPPWAGVLLVLAWTGALVGVLVTVLRFERWSRIGFALYLVLGWLVIVAAPELVRALTATQLLLVAIGGVLYTVGAVVLGRKRPDPSPTWFGYHEVWHAMVVGASACHFAVVALLVTA